MQQPQYPSSHRVLLVEDHGRLAFLMCKMLGMLGYDVHSVKTIADVEAMIDFDFELVLCDYMLPDGNATHLLTYIRERSDLPVILLTAYPIYDLAQETRDRFDVVLTKPVDMDELKRVLGRYLEPGELQSSPG